MTRKVSNFTDLIQRVTAFCLLHPLAASRYDAFGDKEDNYPSETEENKEDEQEEEEKEEDEVYEEENEDYEEEKMVGFRVLKVKQMEILMEVFETVSSMKRAYVRLHEAHSSWDPERMRVADVAVAELRKLAVLLERLSIWEIEH